MMNLDAVINYRMLLNLTFLTIKQQIDGEEVKAKTKYACKSIFIHRCMSYFTNLCTEVNISYIVEVLTSTK